MDSDKLKKMMKQIEDAMTATSFAEEGEIEAAQSFLREGRRVLLALREGQIDARTLKYALNSSIRVGAQLDILYISSLKTLDPLADPMLRQFTSELQAAGITYRLVRKTGCMKQEIIDYTNKEKDILFAVIESPYSLDAECKKRDSRLAELWRNLKCPLVVVMDEAKA
jgi:hypothetical protein